jgi:hypothetical protein
MDQSQDDRLSARLLVVECDGRITVVTHEARAALAEPAGWIPGLNLSRLKLSDEILSADQREIAGHATD